MFNAEIYGAEQQGNLGICQLKRYWSATMAGRAGRPVKRPEEEHIDRVMLDCLGIGLHQSLDFIHRKAPSFADFESWVLATAGRPEADKVAHFNSDLLILEKPEAISRQIQAIEAMAPVLNKEQLDHWQRNGFVVLENAVNQQDLQHAERAVWQAAQARPEDRGSWYNSLTRQGMMIEQIQNSAISVVRQSPRIYKAFAQLWQTANLWVSADRCSFHPPQTSEHLFQGLDLHWDLNFSSFPDFFYPGTSLPFRYTGRAGRSDTGAGLSS